MQEGFLAVWRSAARFVAERAKASTWILTLIHRRAVDLVRREEPRRAEPLDVAAARVRRRHRGRGLAAPAPDPRAGSVSSGCLTSSGRRSSSPTTAASRNPSSPTASASLWAQSRAGCSPDWPASASCSRRRNPRKSNGTSRDPRAERRIRPRRARGEGARGVRGAPRALRRVPRERGHVPAGRRRSWRSTSTRPSRPRALRGRILDQAASERPNGRPAPGARRWALPVAAAAAVAAGVAALALAFWAADLSQQVDDLQAAAAPAERGRHHARRPERERIPARGRERRPRRRLGDPGGPAARRSASSEAPEDQTYEAWVIEGDRAGAGRAVHRRRRARDGRAAQRARARRARSSPLRSSRPAGVDQPTQQPIITSGQAA